MRPHQWGCLPFGRNDRLCHFLLLLALLFQEPFLFQDCIFGCQLLGSECQLSLTFLVLSLMVSFDLIDVGFQALEVRLVLCFTLVELPLELFLRLS